MPETHEIRFSVSAEDWAQLQEMRRDGGHASVSALARIMVRNVLADERLAESEGVESPEVGRILDAAFAAVNARHRHE